MLRNVYFDHFFDVEYWLCVRRIYVTVDAPTNNIMTV